MHNVLEVSHLKKVFYQTSWFGLGQTQSYTAVKDISFSCGKGEVLGVLGANGAGKTTTIHMLLDLTTPTSGTIEYFGKSLQKHRSDILENVGFATAYAKLPSRLRVYDNLAIYARLYGVPRHNIHAKIKSLSQILGVWHLREQTAGSLSAGQRTRVLLVKAFLSDPDIVLLDEPTASLDPEAVHIIRSFILEQKERGVSCILTSHNMYDITQVCDRVIAMRHGEIVANNSPRELAEQVSQAHVELLLTENSDAAFSYFDEHNLAYITKKNGCVVITIDEQRIAHLLQDLAQRNVLYSEISIKKPTLEDYFFALENNKTETS